jgi:putative ABC transport system ATP-binding protein
MLQIHHLSKIYLKAKIVIPALNDVSFNVTKSEFIGIIGKSGSGKSTLLNLIGGLDRPSGGEIIFMDRDLARMSRYELALHRRYSVGMIFQSFNLIPSLSALENVVLPLTFAGVSKKKRKQVAGMLLEMTGLADRTDHLPTELSGGETQRVAIARALANEPSMLLADEPTGNLDSVTAREIIGLLRDLNKNKGITVLLVTHDQETAEEISDHIIRLKDGQIVDGTERKR